MQVILGLRETMRFIGLTPHTSLLLQFLRAFLTVSMLYINIGALWFIFVEGQTFGEIAKALSSFFIYVDVLAVYIIYLVIRRQLFDVIMVLGDLIDERKLNYFHEIFT